ncbi:stage II sporulation protein P|uniref:Stage II sporulation protein P n=1 Tax=Dendrosporobacter quercicolus TaxID=146817 RepID=A0A1G9V311_9FIRM|nr:stage II sporulation protein P [Dendrosporobacter quercicolus]NSL47943.1 stage II sporulation protein P [Dendrosporobacter quercicolus DSM 1736]SDM66426.1 stage II sporulation protein P [Dendrosporobacter quercicolus]
MRCFAFLIALLLICSAPANASLPDGDSDELESGYITIIDEAGEIVMQTGRNVRPGDQYISEENHLYEVTAVEGLSAKARFIRTETDIAMEASAIPAQTQSNPALPIISVYHTHTDESYIPTDGRSSIPGRGTIMLVGDVFTNRLRELGYEVNHSKTLHDPHDANAYHRSRRTFMKLLQNQPVALFDLHRDSGPLSAYSVTINGKPTAKILLVVGWQNQNRRTTLNYAKRIKAAADAKYRGLIRGIFVARGNYNQDLNPRAMLVEVGTQYNSRDAAEHSVALLADVVPSILQISARNSASASPVEGAADQPGAAESPAEESYAGDLLYIIGAVVIGGLGYLYLSTGSWNEAINKLNRFIKYEFRDIFNSRRRRK